VTLTMSDMASARAGQDDGVAAGKGPQAGRAKRRTFTAEYKLRIVAEYEQLDDPGARGALLRREGLYSSHISEWRRARDNGAAAGLAEKPSGRPGRPADAENERLRRENEKLAAELARTKAALEVVGKAHALLELLSESADSEKKRQR
jgi:transposase